MDEQLQLGPVEEIKDVQLAPLPEKEAAPAVLGNESVEEQVMYDASMIPEAELATPVDMFSGNALAPFEPVGEAVYAPMTLTQLEGAAEQLSRLTGTELSINEIRLSFNEGVFGTKVDEAIKNMLSASDANKQEAMLSILNRGDLSVPQRLEIIAQLDAQRGPDMNAADRQELVQLNQQENGTGYDDESEARYVASLKEIAEVPRIARVETPLSQEELQQSFTEMLNLYAADADKRSGELFGVNVPYAGATTNFIPMLAPFFGTVPIVKVMKELAKSSGVDIGMSTTQGAFLPGSALRSMREAIERMPIEEKVKTFGKVLRVLKGNRAIFPTQNAHMQSYIVQSLFHKDMTGQDFIKQATDKENKAYYAAMAEADHWGRQMDHTQGEARAEAVRKRAEAMGRADKIYLASSGRMWHEYNKVELSQWLDDMAILDFSLIAPLARGTIKLGQKGGLIAGGMKRALNVAPTATTDKMLTLLQDPRARKKMSSLLGEDIAETMLPAAVKGAEEAGVEGMGELVERAERLRKEIKLTLQEGSGVTQQMQRDYAAELERIFGSYTQQPMMHTTKSVFTPTDEGVEVVARYGATPTKSFATAKTALTALEKLPVDGRIVKKLPDGTYAPASALDDTKVGEYFIEVADKRTYDSSRAAWQEAVFPREQVRALPFLPANSAIGGKAAKLWNWFMSSPEVFGKDIFNKITSDSMRAAAVQKLHTGFTRTMLNLPKEEQALVSVLLKQGEEIPTNGGRGTVFTTEQIRTMYPNASDAVVKSYYEARQLADEMYDLANGQMRAEFFREGVKAIHSTSGHVGFGRVLESADDAVADIKAAQGYTTLHVFDAETGTYQALHRSEVDDLYKKGKKLARMEELIQGKNFDEATHVIVDNAQRVRELPMHVLPRVNGYYPHIFAANYVVYGVSKAGNKVALGLARTIGDAQKEVARLGKVMTRMGAKAPYQSLDYRFDRSLRDPLMTDKDVGGAIFNPTSKVYGSRSGRVLRNASKQYGDHMVDPIEAMLRGMELVSHSVTKGNLIKNMEARLYNTLRLMERESGQKIIKDPTKLVKTEDDINFVSTKKKDLQKAVTYMRQIDMVRRIPDDVESTMSNLLAGSTEIFYKLAQKVGKLKLPGAKSVAADITRLEEMAATRASKGVDPMRLLTEIGHRTMIAGNPLQQFALQLAQSLMVLGIAPRDYPKAISQAGPLYIAVNTRIMMNSAKAGTWVEAYKALLPKGARMMGLSEEKFDKLVGVIERSGLIDTVSVHSQITTAARSSAMSRMLATASTANQGKAGRVTMDVLRSADDATFGNLSRIGFESGEQLNRLVTFMSLYNRDIRKGIADLNKPAYIQSLVGEVNTLVGSMLRETSMGYQRGWLKAAFQFVAFQHKMATMVFSKNLSWQQKVGLSLSQFLLFGSRGAAHLDAFHRITDNYMQSYEASNPEEKSQMLELYYSDEVQTALDGIVFDGGVNSLIRVVGGDDTPGFAWNRRIAPGGGSEMLVDSLIELRNNPTTKVFGLSGKHGSKLYKFHEKVRRYMLASAMNMDDVMAPQERFAMLVKEGAGLAFSGYNKYLQASVMKTMGGPVSDTGNVSMGSGTYVERVLAAALGVNTEDRQAFLDATDKYYADIRNDPKKHKAAMDETAETLYKEIVTEMIKLKGEAATPEVYEDMQTRLLAQKAYMLSFLTPHEAEVVSEKIGDKIAEAIKNRDTATTAEQAFIDDLTSDLREGKFGDKESLEWETYLRRTPLFEKYPNLFGDFRELRREMLTYDDEEQ